MTILFVNYCFQKMLAKSVHIFGVFFVWTQKSHMTIKWILMTIFAFSKKKLLMKKTKMTKTIELEKLSKKTFSKNSWNFTFLNFQIQIFLSFLVFIQKLFFFVWRNLLLSFQKNLGGPLKILISPTLSGNAKWIFLVKMIPQHIGF